MKKIHPFIIIFVLVYLLLPLFATFLYSIATEWDQTILPKSYTFTAYQQLFGDPRFMEAMGRTFLVCLLSLLISVVVMIVTIYVVTLYLPKYEKILQGLVMMPYAIPGVVAAVGLIKIYSSGPIILAGSIWLLVGAYFILILPYMYQGIRNSLRTINGVRLVEAAELLGASKMRAFCSIIIPNIRSGILISVLLSFSILFGEFVLANLLIGGQYETIQIYLMKRLSENGHISSAVVISYFLFILLVSWGMLKLGNLADKRSQSKNEGDLT